ncbi:MAG TPA: ATP-binding protein [Bacteroidales bacterium]|nr:ATP-binding protein [Bacteroidales bacterium]
MIELSLNILDIVQNSIRAGAEEISIEISESKRKDKLEVVINDNGSGIPPEILPTVDDPFTTTRTTRKTGLGLPLLKYHAEITGGRISIESSGKGTSVKALFGLSHIDRQPLGDIEGVMTILISANPGIELLYKHNTDNGLYSFSTIETKEALGIERFDDYSLLEDIKQMIRENLEDIGVSS